VKYGAILVDPPWSFLTYGKHRTTPHRCAVDHYTTMDAQSLAKLPVSDMAAKDCALFLWVVGSHVDEGIRLAEGWGFKYKTDAFVWVKTAQSGAPRIGMGYWTRKSAETCLLFTRGKPSRKSKGVRQVITAPRREHSRKPDEIYERIEALVSGPYLEMFARQRRTGWDAWGNEVDKFETAE
jgi:N6-adenosine-specific RNA methylase IME4